jgi:hypothetical protein
LPNDEGDGLVAELTTRHSLLTGKFAIDDFPAQPERSPVVERH